MSKNEHFDLVYFIPSGLKDGVVYSQILTPAYRLRDLGLAIGVYSTKAKFKNVNSPRTALKKARHIYVRSYKDFILVYLLRFVFFAKCKIIYDFRALVCYESYYKNKSKFRFVILRQLERFAYKMADHICAVSHSLKRQLIKEFGLRNISINPCCVNEVFKREKLIENHVQFVYLGGMSSWQCFNDVLKLYEQIEEKNAFTSTLTVITQDLTKAGQLIETFRPGGRNIILISLPPEQVFTELKKYDFGFLLREENIINKVASPIKLLEYVACGVIPVISNNIGDFSEEIDNKKLGIVLEMNRLTDEAWHSFCAILNKKNQFRVYEKMYEFAVKHTWSNMFRSHDIYGLMIDRRDHEKVRKAD